jgi:hypothetical protein
LPYHEALAKMCGKDGKGIKRLAIYALGENPELPLDELRSLSEKVFGRVSMSQDSLLAAHHKQYANNKWNDQDVAYLLGRNPLEIWLVNDLQEHRSARWAEVLERSRGARRKASEWIQPKRLKDAQNTRIRIELERRAFVEIHKSWKRLGYPFDSLVPSLATAIGSSADRPQALAELVGVIQCDGRRVPFLRVEELHFGIGTPYETHFEPAQGPGDQVMPRDVAFALKKLMNSVVEGGTARRVQGCLEDEEGHAIAIGGKTGSGDNRVEKFASNGAVISSRAVSRTASFVFTIGDHFFGMISAYVPGEDAGKYYFTSSLALQAFKTLAPSFEPLVRAAEAGSAQAKARPDAPAAVEAADAVAVDANADAVTVVAAPAAPSSGAVAIATREP